NAMEAAAKNPSGMAGGGMAMGAGFAMANQMGNAMAQPGTAAGPPPLPRAVAYFADIGGQQAGPFDAAAFQQQVGGGRITRDPLGGKQGMGDWLRAGDVAELARVFSRTPPPMPR